MLHLFKRSYHWYETPMGMVTTWQTATDTEILCLPFSISRSVTAKNLICPCLSLPLCNSVLFPITLKTMGSLLYSRFRSHFLLAGKAAPWARPLSWWNQWELYRQFQQLQDQPSSTMQQKQQQIQSNAHHCNCANMGNVSKMSKTHLRRWTIFFAGFFVFFFSLNECHRLYFSNSILPLEGRDLSALKESY